MSEDKQRPTVFMMDLLATVPYYTAYLSQALLKKRVNLTVGSISYYLDPGCFSNRGIKLDSGFINVVGNFQMPRLPRRVLKLLESLLNLAALSLRFLVSPPDIVHVQFLPMVAGPLPLDLWFVRLCQRRGSKIVLTVHDLLPHNTGESHRQTFLDLYQMVDRIICHSESIRERLAIEFAAKEEKVTVIPHGPFFYDLAATAEQTLQSFELDPRTLLVLWQGILSPYKGIDLLLEAWQSVETSVEDARLLIVGTGPAELIGQIREQIRNLKLQRVQLHPRFISTEELVALYRAADIVVYPYRAITTSGALATGLALGKTIIASDLPVFRELLTDRETAFFFDPQKPAELADAITQLLGDALLRERLAENVRKMNFGEESWLSIADKTIDCYKFVQPPELWYKK